MEMRKKDIIETGVQGVVTLISILSIFLFGSVFLIAGTCADKDGESTFYCEVYFPGQGGMNGTETPAAPGGQLISVPAVIGGSTFDYNRPAQKAISSAPQFRIKINRPECFSTIAFNCPQKAAEFTLVGAKPSGTG